MQHLHREQFERGCISITGGGLKSESGNNFLADRPEISSSEGPRGGITISIWMRSEGRMGKKKKTTLLGSQG